MVRTSGSQSLQDKPGGVFLRRADIMPEADRILLHAVARVVVVTERGALEDQLVRRPVEEELPPAFAPRFAVAHLPGAGAWPRPSSPSSTASAASATAGAST